MPKDARGSGGLDCSNEDLFVVITLAPVLETDETRRTLAVPSNLFFGFLSWYRAERNRVLRLLDKISHESCDDDAEVIVKDSIFQVSDGQCDVAYLIPPAASQIVFILEINSGDEDDYPDFDPDDDPNSPTPGRERYSPFGVAEVIAALDAANVRFERGNNVERDPPAVSPVEHQLEGFTDIDALTAVVPFDLSSLWLEELDRHSVLASALTKFELRCNNVFIIGGADLAVQALDLDAVWQLSARNLRFPQELVHVDMTPAAARCAYTFYHGCSTAALASALGNEIVAVTASQVYGVTNLDSLRLNATYRHLALHRLLLGSKK